MRHQMVFIFSNRLTIFIPLYDFFTPLSQSFHGLAGPLPCLTTLQSTLWLIMYRLIIAILKSPRCHPRAAQNIFHKRRFQSGIHCPLPPCYDNLHIMENTRWLTRRTVVCNLFHFRISRLFIHIVTIPRLLGNMRWLASRTFVCNMEGLPIAVTCRPKLPGGDDWVELAGGLAENSNIFTNNSENHKS